jgi:hypothetical protein
MDRCGVVGSVTTDHLGAGGVGVDGITGVPVGQPDRGLPPRVAVVGAVLADAVVAHDAECSETSAGRQDRGTMDRLDQQ